MADYPKVGTGVYIFNEKGELLLGRRKSAHGKGKWSPPGGHLEFGESFEDCAKRETMEETGLIIENVCFWGITNDIFAETEKHYITLHFKAEAKSASPKINEPEKWEKWEWFECGNLPPEKDLFIPVANFIKQNNLCGNKI